LIYDNKMKCSSLLYHILILASNPFFISTLALTTTSTTTRKNLHDIETSKKLNNTHKKQTSSLVKYPLKDSPRRTFLKELRRGVLSSSLVVGMSTAWFPNNASAKPDCMYDCLKNCKLIAPKVRTQAAMTR
jgi:hypothetical protein